MKRIIERPFRDYFKADLASMDSISLSLPVHVRWSRCINPLSVVAGITAFCLLVGLVSKVAFSLGVALVLFLGFVYLQTRSIARNLYVKRKLTKNKFFEFEEIEVRYSLLNASGSRIPPLKIKDRFGPSKDELVIQEVPVAMEKESRRSFLYKRIADSGMGIKNVGPISVCFTDQFGLFEFEVMDDEVLEVEVLPKVEELPELELVGSANSQRYGKYTVNSRGASVNFVGVREYEQGDPLKNIAWKLSAKTGNLLVKEFEKMVNAEVSLFMNLEPTLQIGSSDFSTWELIKDITLSLASQQIRQSNSVRFFTQNLYLESLTGDQGMHELARRLIALHPMADEGLEFGQHEQRLATVEQLVKKFVGWHQAGDNIVVITPYITADSNSLCQSLGSLKKLGINVHCVLINTAAFYSKLLSSIEYKFKFSAPAMNGLEKTVHRLKVLGVSVVVLDPDTDVPFSFLKSGSLR